MSTDQQAEPAKPTMIRAMSRVDNARLQSSTPVSHRAAGRLASSQIVALQRSIGNAAVAKLLRGEQEERHSAVGDVVGKGGGQPLDAATEAPVESSFGQGFSGVRIHSDAKAAESSPGLGPAEARIGPSQVIALQRSIGNAAVARLLRGQGEGQQSPVRDIVGKGGGRPLDAETRARMESSFGQDFSGVRIHNDAKAADSARSVGARAYTVGSDIVLGSANADHSSPAWQRTLAHELTHVVQQRSGPVDGVAAPGGIRLSDPSDRFEREAEQVAHRVMAREASRVADGSGPALQRVPRARHGASVSVQRHSSWEHRLIGDMPPDDLFKLGAHEDLRNANAPTVNVNDLQGNQQPVLKINVEHLLLQEIHRLRVWQTSPPDVTSASGLAQATTSLQAKAAAHPTLNDQWGVRLVMIPAAGPKDKPLVLTYGELNTLADFYGSVDELKRAKPNRRRAIVQGVRKESYQKLLGTYAKLKGVSEKQAVKDTGGKLKFKGATRGGGSGGFVKLTTRNRTGARRATDKFGAVVARNACHFAPESWHAWESYHRKAVKLAQTAKLARDQGQARLADQKLNEALLENGFGDHYLQDSYASGHLINKTQIMQWYVQFLDREKNKIIKGMWEQEYRTYTRDTAWRQRQAMAYLQPGLASKKQYKKHKIGERQVGGMNVPTARNPQAVEDTTSLGAAFTWQDRFKMLGLRTPPSVTAGSPALHLLLWMQRSHGNVAQSRYDVRWTWSSLKNKASAGKIPDITNEYNLRVGLAGLLDDGVVFSETQTNRGAGSRLEQGVNATFFTDSRVFELRKEWVVSVFNKKDKFEAAATAATGAAPDMGQYDKMMQASVHKDFTAFMEDALLQKGMNALHDYFCKNGLTVSTGANQPAFKVYGDEAMMASQSSAGLRESATTANYSRDSILAVEQTGQEPAGMTTSDILNRLPDHVVDHHGATVSLEDWHNGGALKDFVDQNVFPHVSGGQSFAGGTIGAPGARKVPLVAGGKLGITTERHGADAF